MTIFLWHHNWQFPLQELNLLNNIDKIEVFHLKLSIPWKNQDNTDKNILDESY